MLITEKSRESEREKEKLLIIENPAGAVSDLGWMIRILELNIKQAQKPNRDEKMQDMARKLCVGCC